MYTSTMLIIFVLVLLIVVAAVMLNVTKNERQRERQRERERLEGLIYRNSKIIEKIDTVLPLSRLVFEMENQVIFEKVFVNDFRVDSEGFIEYVSSFEKARNSLAAFARGMSDASSPHIIIGNELYDKEKIKNRLSVKIV